MSAPAPITILVAQTTIPHPVVRQPTAFAGAIIDRVKLVTGDDRTIEVTFVTMGEHRVEPADIDKTYPGLTDYIRHRVIPGVVFDIERNALADGDVFLDVMNSARREIPSLEREVERLHGLIEPAEKRLSALYADLVSSSKLGVRLVDLFARQWRDWYSSEHQNRGTFSDAWWRLVADPASDGCDSEDYARLFGVKPWVEHSHQFTDTEITQLNVVHARAAELADAIEQIAGMLTIWQGEHGRLSQRLAGLRDLVHSTEPVVDYQTGAAVSVAEAVENVRRLAAEIGRKYGTEVVVGVVNDSRIVVEPRDGETPTASNVD